MAEGDYTRGTLRVTHFVRYSNPGFFSVERVFAAVRQAFPPEIDCRVARCRFSSRGFWRRAWSVVEAPFHQGDVNHITGDVHFLAMLLRRPRTLLTIHDLRINLQSRGLRRWLLNLFWVRIPLRRAALVTVISEATKRDLLTLARIEPDRVRVVYDPLPPGFDHAPKPFNAHCPRILQMGTAPWKNIERVAEALHGIPCHLRIVGPLRPEQHAALARCGIEFSNVSGLSDAAVVAEYHHCDMLVFASTFEGFGMPIVEAQAVGRPVLTSRLPPMDEVAANAACLVDPFDPQSIRAGLLRILGKPEYRASLVELGRDNVRRFDPRIVAAQYVALYRELANR